ncbi:MAG: hypothetical protein KH200_12115 [Clostridium sp.]|nr:hypothetical protein [Clostridium sp.]MBS6888638.1 hypothetical protein [Clostridium sp.]
MRLFSIELEDINGVQIPRVELDYRFSSLKKNDIVKIHDIISNCYKDVMSIYIEKEQIQV